MICLDTSVLVDLLQGEPTVERRLDAIDQRIAVAYPIICELYKGVYKSDDPEKGERTVGQLLESIELLETGRSAGKEFGKLKAAYPHKDEFDLMIASIVAAADVQLLTRDSDFDDIDEISVEIL